jgi:hypothetical protein
MSDANRTAVGIVEEDSYLAGTPATPAFENLRVTAVNLAHAKKTDDSKELSADGNVKDLITLGFEAGGDLPQEQSFDADHTIDQGALRSTWLRTPERENTTAAPARITAVSATEYTVAASSGVKGQTGAYAEGMLVRASGFADAGNNRLFRAAATSSGTNVEMTGGTVDASPDVGARLKVVGFEGATSDLVAVAGGAATQGLTSTALDFTTLGLYQGQWVYVGSETADNAYVTNPGGWCRIAPTASRAITATSLPFDIVPAGWVADAGTGQEIRVYIGDSLRNGTTRRSYSLEVQYQDIAVPEYDLFESHVVAEKEWEFDQQSIARGKTTFLGLNAENSTTRTTGATDVAAPTNDVFNTSANIGAVLENGTAFSGVNILQKVVLTVNNNLRRNNGLGSLVSVGIGMGRHVIKATLSMYYGDNTVLNKIRSSTASGLFLPVVDAVARKAMLYDIPRLKYGAGNPTTPGIDTDRMLDTEAQGIKHPQLGYSFAISRFEEYGT